MNVGAGASGAASGAAMGSAFGPYGTAIGAVGGGVLGLMSGDPAEGVNIGEKQWDATRGYIKGGNVPTWLGGQGLPGQGQPAGPGSGGQALSGANGVGHVSVPNLQSWIPEGRYGPENYAYNAWVPQSAPPPMQGVGLMDPNIAPSQAASVYQGVTLNDLVPGWGGRPSSAPQVPPQVAAPGPQAAPPPASPAPQQAAPLPGLTAYANSSKPDWMSERDWRHFDRLANLRRNG